MRGRYRVAGENLLLQDQMSRLRVRVSIHPEAAEAFCVRVFLD